MNKGQFIGRLPQSLGSALIPMGHNGSRSLCPGSLMSSVPRWLTALCVRYFLPAAGNRNGTSINNVGTNGNYWSTTSQSATNAYNVNFNASNFNSQNNNNRYNGFSVRLASAVELTLVSILPAAGRRDGTSFNNVGTNGNYWSTTSYNATNAYNVNFNADNFNSQNNWDRFRGFSVRLASAAALTLVWFLPAAGNRNGTSINNVGSEGNYWSTTSQSATNAYNVNFNASNFNSQNSNNRYIGRSVRLAFAAALTLEQICSEKSFRRAFPLPEGLL